MCIMIFTSTCIFILFTKPDANQAAQQVSIELKEHEKVHVLIVHMYMYMQVHVQSGVWKQSVIQGIVQ